MLILDWWWLPKKSLVRQVLMQDSQICLKFRWLERILAQAVNRRKRSVIECRYNERSNLKNTRKQAYLLYGTCRAIRLWSGRELDISEEHKAIVRDRIKKFDKNPERLLDWEQVHDDFQLDWKLIGLKLSRKPIRTSKKPLIGQTNSSPALDFLYWSKSLT